jgi:hypothetical protein
MEEVVQERDDTAGLAAAALATSAISHPPHCRHRHRTGGGIIDGRTDDATHPPSPPTPPTWRYLAISRWRRCGWWGLTAVAAGRERRRGRGMIEGVGGGAHAKFQRYPLLS